MGTALLWEAEHGEGEDDEQHCSWAASLLGTITPRELQAFLCRLMGYRTTHTKLQSPSLTLCEWQ